MAKPVRSARKIPDPIPATRRDGAGTALRGQIVTSSCAVVIDPCAGRLLRPIGAHVEYELIGTLEKFAPVARGDGMDEWLTAKQAAPMLNVVPQYLYRHWRKLRFAKKLSPKCLRFSRRGILDETQNREVKR